MNDFLNKFWHLFQFSEIHPAFDLQDAFILCNFLNKIYSVFETSLATIDTKNYNPVQSSVFKKVKKYHLIPSRKEREIFSDV